MDLSGYLIDLSRPAPTVTESILRALRQAILEGALAGGTVLRQELIAKKFGVSRVPVREALLRLEGEGLVETQPRRGVVVTALTAEDFEEILDMRYALESLAIGLTAANFTARDAKHALETVIDAERALKKPVFDADAEFDTRWGEANWEFHKRLYLPAKRPRLLDAIENLHQLFARHLRSRIKAMRASVQKKESQKTLSAARLKEWAVAIDEHRQMVSACTAHDATTAVKILKRHISDHGSELVRKLRENGTAV